MKKIIFICRGNLIRSQICKAVYNKLAQNDSYAESYGTEVQKDHNEGVEIQNHEHLSNLIKIMRDHDMDISKEKSKQLTQECCVNAFKIIIMGEKEKIPRWLEKYNYEYWEDCLNGPEKNKKFNLNIKITKFGDADDIEDTILFLKQKVENLIKTLK
jgi:protein-tyrosine-phosphatase